VRDNSIHVVAAEKAGLKLLSPDAHRGNPRFTSSQTPKRLMSLPVEDKQRAPEHLGAPPFLTEPPSSNTGENFDELGSRHG
jgi:hypothetical protein